MLFKEETKSTADPDIWSLDIKYRGVKCYPLSDPHSSEDVV